jgi:hypothetical protein
MREAARRRSTVARSLRSLLPYFETHYAGSLRSALDLAHRSSWAHRSRSADDLASAESVYSDHPCPDGDRHRNSHTSRCGSDGDDDATCRDATCRDATCRDGTCDHGTGCRW